MAEMILPPRPVPLTPPNKPEVVVRPRTVEEVSAVMKLAYANEIFVILPSRMHDALQDAGAQYHPWPSDRPGERAFRLVTAFDTDPADVDQFLSIAKGAAKAA